MAEYIDCEMCNITFRKKRDWQKFCSPKCSQKALRERRVGHSATHVALNAENAALPHEMPHKTSLGMPFDEDKSRLIVHGPNGRKWGRNPKQLTPQDLEAEGIRDAQPLSVMRAMCLDCRDADGVLTCARVHCPLWPYRLGTNPWRRDDERLNKARAAKCNMMLT